MSHTRNLHTRRGFLFAGAKRVLRFTSPAVSSEAAIIALSNLEQSGHVAGSDTITHAESDSTATNLALGLGRNFLDTLLPATIAARKVQRDYCEGGRIRQLIGNRTEFLAARRNILLNLFGNEEGVSGFELFHTRLPQTANGFFVFQELLDVFLMKYLEKNPDKYALFETAEQHSKELPALDKKLANMFGGIDDQNTLSGPLQLGMVFLEQDDQTPIMELALNDRNGGIAMRGVQLVTSRLLELLVERCGEDLREEIYNALLRDLKPQINEFDQILAGRSR